MQYLDNKEGQEVPLRPLVDSYQELVSPKLRGHFYRDVIETGMQTTDPVNYSICHLLSFIGFLDDGLQATNQFEAKEASYLAGLVVFEGVRAYITITSGSTHNTRRLFGIDQLIRTAHQLDPQQYPLDHPDQYVASFYETFHTHLPLGVSNTGYSQFGDYLTAS